MQFYGVGRRENGVGKKRRVADRAKSQSEIGG